MKRTKMISTLAAAGLLIAAPVRAQSQFQSSFELGVGYTRPAIESIDMASFLLQADDFLLETGIGIRTNSGAGGDDTVFSWLVRAAARSFQLGNVRGHFGGEFSLHTNAAVDESGEIGTLIGLGFLIGASHQLADHLNAEVHVYPITFEFGGEDTVAKIAVAEVGVHLLF
jgi:hypothetical protein